MFLRRRLDVCALSETNFSARAGGQRKEGLEWWSEEVGMVE